MDKMNKEMFILPNFPTIREISENEKIVIVSIVGKTPFKSSGAKVKSIGQIFKTGATQDTLVTIEGVYNRETKTIFLHLHSPLDCDVLLKNFEAIRANLKEEENPCDFLAINDEIKTNFAKALLLLAHLSHIVVLSHPGSSFDTSYLQYFKALDHLSQKYAQEISECLEEGIGEFCPEWVARGRFCTPRLIFHFERTPKGATNHKQLAHNLEDRIYHILKKTRLINHYSSLFAIPLNEEFVYFAAQADGTARGVDDLAEMVRGLIEDCSSPSGGGGSGVSVAPPPPFSCETYGKNGFLQFLNVHIKRARGKGFNDIPNSSGRHALTKNAHFELPELRYWIICAKSLYSLILPTTLSEPSKTSPISFNLLATDTNFSRQRCSKVLPMAMARYQENAPIHYSVAEHQRRIGASLALFVTQARGPVFDAQLARLEADCERYWSNGGRQQCEHPSLSGNLCKLPKHGDEQEHMSGIVFKSICDCGRKSGTRDDPYTLKQANYEFYQQMAAECVCGGSIYNHNSKLERIPMPIDEKRPDGMLTTTSTNNIPRTTNPPSPIPITTLLPPFPSWSLISLGASSLYSHSLGLGENQFPGFLSGTNFLLPWDVLVKGWANSRASIRNRRIKTTPNTLIITNQNATTSSNNNNNSVVGQFNVKVFIGVEYECPVGHRFMLAAPDRILNATTNVANQSSNSSSGDNLKDTAQNLVESDLPLYFPCVCGGGGGGGGGGVRGAKLAQLMRLHMVTPKTPVCCMLDPKVQPAPGAPIFVSGLETPYKLTPSSYWIMRLPFAYALNDGSEKYCQNLGGKLLQGTFSVKGLD